MAFLLKISFIWSMINIKGRKTLFDAIFILL